MGVPARQTLYCVRLRFHHTAEDVTQYYASALLRLLAITGYGDRVQVLCEWEE